MYLAQGGTVSFAIAEDNDNKKANQLDPEVVAELLDLGFTVNRHHTSVGFVEEIYLAWQAYRGIHCKQASRVDR